MTGLLLFVAVGLLIAGSVAAIIKRSPTRSAGTTVPAAAAGSSGSQPATTTPSVSSTADRAVVFVSGRVHPNWPGDLMSVAQSGGEPNLLVSEDQLGGRALTFAWSPDRTRLVVSVRFPDGTCRGVEQATSLEIVELASGAVRALTPIGCGVDVDPAWSPGGTQIVYVTSGHTTGELVDTALWTIAPDGSNGRELVAHDAIPPQEFPVNTKYYEYQGDEHPSFSPDGRQIVFGRHNTLRVGHLHRRRRRLPPAAGVG